MLPGASKMSRHIIINYTDIIIESILVVRDLAGSAMLVSVDWEQNAAQRCW